MNKVILVGGIYGSGKTTIGEALEREGRVIDYDNIIGDVKGNGVLKTPESMEPIRQQAWGYLFLNALVNSVRMGNPVTVGIATFTTRERRDRYFDTLSKEAEVTGIYYMLPMKETIDRIRRDRTKGEKLVNGDTVLDFYRTHNRTFIKQDHSDLKIPDTLPAEYRSLLRMSGYLPGVQRWTVVTQPLTLTDFNNVKASS